MPGDLLTCIGFAGQIASAIVVECPFGPKTRLIFAPFDA
jgi:hypothetical protein